jgi:hypothetical protein
MLVVAARSVGAAPAGFRVAFDAPLEDLGLGARSRLERDGERWWLDGRPIAAVPGVIEEPARWEPLPRVAPRGALAARLEALLPDLPLDPEWQHLFRTAVALGRCSPLAPLTAVLARTLLGRGPGSTPIGDDFLVGWLAGLARQRRAAPPAQRMLGERLAETCRLSRHFLHHALSGRFHEAFVRLAGLAAPPELDHPWARALCAQGDRSGRAALAGFLTGLHQGA